MNTAKHERLRIARLSAGFKSASQAAAALGVRPPTYTHHENGTRDFDNDTAERYARRLGTSVDWLVFGRGDAPKMSGQRPRLVESFDPDEVTREADDRLAMSSTGVSVGDIPAGGIIEADVRIGLGGGGVPALTDVLGSDGNTYAAEGIRSIWQLPHHVTDALFRVPSGRVRCFEAHGDSMAPSIDAGDFVFIDIGHRVPSPPGIYALCDPLGGVICKRVEVISVRGEDPVRLRILSDNPLHAPAEMTLDEVSIVGRLLGRMTRA